MVIAGLCGALFALVADRLSHWFFAITTLAFAVMLIGLVLSLDIVGGATGLYRIPLAIGFREVAICLIAAIVFVVWLDSTRLGHQMRAVRDSELAGKRALRAGEMLDGEGGYTVWGKLLPAAATGALPIGLAHKVRLKTDLAHGALVRWSDVEIEVKDDTVVTRRAMEARCAS